MDYLIGMDVGTSGVKTALFDTSGVLVTSATEEYPITSHKDGWAEQHPDLWWEAAVKTLRAVTDKAAQTNGTIAGMGFSGQMHGLVCLDEAGVPLRPAILWCDARTGAECDEIHRRVGLSRLMEITGNPALAGFTASKLMWIQKHEPHVYAQCRHIMLPKDYVRYKLTGTLACEASDAAGTNLLDLRARRWSDEILAALAIDAAWLPPVLESPQNAGCITHEAARETGLPAGMPVAAGAGDNAAAAVGMGVIADGKSFVSIGTSGVLYTHASQLKIDPQGRVHSFCSAVPGEFLVMGVTLCAGLSLSWFRGEFFPGESYAALDAKAARSPIGAGGLIFLPYLMGDRSPHKDPDARGVFLGLSASHTKQDMLRAVMEGISYSLKDCATVLADMGVPLTEIMACGGGGQSPFWRAMLADLLGHPVVTGKIAGQGAALGAAILGGVCAGVYGDVKTACAQLIKADSVQQPSHAVMPAYQAVYDVYRSLYPRLKDVFGDLKQLRK